MTLFTVCSILAFIWVAWSIWLENKVLGFGEKTSYLYDRYEYLKKDVAEVERKRLFYVSHNKDLFNLIDDRLTSINERLKCVDKKLMSIEPDFYSLREVKVRIEKRKALEEELKNLGGDK